MHSATKSYDSEIQSRFCVLLATYNGDAFLSDQLRSLAGQSVENIDLLISDDGSTDGTGEIIEEFSESWQKGATEFVVRQRLDDENSNDILASSRNFQSLILGASSDYDFYAFCDQDDVWDSAKLQSAKEWFDTQSPDIPAIFCSTVRIIWEDGSLSPNSSTSRSDLNFKNAIVQNVVAGNTLVLNKAAFELIKRVSESVRFVSHDWWSYLVVSACGGRVYCSPEPLISYRRHGNNLIGDDGSNRASLRKVYHLLGGRYRKWNEVNRLALIAIEDHMSDDALQTLSDFDAARKKFGLAGVSILKRSGIHRKTLFGQLTLYLSCVLGKL